MGKRKAKIKATGLMLVLIIMLMTGLIYINNLNSTAKQPTTSTKSMELLGQVDAKEKLSKVSAVEDILVEAVGAVIKGYSLDGKEAWNKTMTGKIESMKNSGSRLIVLDSSKKLYCLGKSGNIIWEKQLDDNVKDYYIDRSGHVLVDHTIDKGTKIRIFNSKGVEEGSMVLNNAYVLAFAAGEEENSISVIDISTQIIKTKLLTLNMRGDIVWSENIDNQIIAMLGYTKDNSLIAIGEKDIYKYKNQSKGSDKLSLSKSIYNSSISDNAIAVTVRGKNGYEVHTFDPNLKEIGVLQQENQPMGILLDKSNYILYSNERLQLLDLKGKLKAEHIAISEIKNAYFGESNCIIVVSDKLMQKLSY